MLAEIFVMRLVNTDELIEQFVMGLYRLKRIVGYRGKFFIEDEEDQIALILGIVEEGPKSDVGAPGDLAKRGRLVSMLGKKRARRRTNALALVQFILFPESKLRRQYAHNL